MKLRTTLLALLPLLAAGCAPTRIVTVTPSTNYTSVYTTVTAPVTRTVTRTEVYAADDDICLQLDLQAVAAAFAQSSNVQEFESLINSSSFMISNLDLNRDGYVDYLRVLETVDRGTHVFLIQAVLAQNVFQDVATLIAEVPNVTNYHVQIVGAPYIYGTNYIIQPVFFTRPLIFTHLVKPAYNPWHSPWYWSHFPTYYKHPAPIHLNHYMAYVDTYMKNHRYCHECSYPSSCHYPNYQTLSKPNQRNDYGAQHPDRSFNNRNANGKASQPVYNARNIAENRKAASVTTVTPARTANTTATPSRSTSTATPSRSTTTTTPARSNTTTTTSRSTSTTTPARSASSSGATSSAASSGNSQTTRSRVTSSGSSSTKITTSSSSTGSKTTTRTGSAVRR